MIQVLSNDHYDAIFDLFDSSEQSIQIVSPFLSLSMAEKLCSIVSRQGLTCSFITRLYIQDLLSKANNLDALSLMLDSSIQVYAVKGLHTKLYLFDRSSAVLGSANFTASGFKTNIELSLLFREEPAVLNELNSYFDVLLSQIKGEGAVTPDMLAEAREIYKNVWAATKGKGTTFSGKMYGADLGSKTKFDSTASIMKELEACKRESDIIFDCFRETEVVEQIRFDHTIWLKFNGEADARLASDDPYEMVQVPLDGHMVYVENYPFKVSSIKDGDEVYLAGLTTDRKGKNQPVIMGRGRMRGFSASNHVLDSWLADYPWMSRFPWFCILDECEVLNAKAADGIPMDSVWEALGSDTYLASFGRNETAAEVSRKHYQKAHIRLSGNAKVYIDKQFDTLAQKYGVTRFTSE